MTTVSDKHIQCHYCSTTYALDFYLQKWLDSQSDRQEYQKNRFLVIFKPGARHPQPAFVGVRLVY